MTTKMKRSQEYSRALTGVYQRAAWAGQQMEVDGGLTKETDATLKHCLKELRALKAPQPAYERLTGGRAEGIITLCAYIAQNVRSK